MSLYNMLFGVEPVAGIALKMLGTNPSEIPRFRDAYFTWADDAKTVPEIVILTRTGGGNREYYDNPDEGASNADLRALPGFKHDADDDYDCTFALFRFSVPAEFLEQTKCFLSQEGAPPSLKEKFDMAIKAIKPAKAT